MIFLNKTILIILVSILITPFSSSCNTRTTNTINTTIFTVAKSMIGQVKCLRMLLANSQADSITDKNEKHIYNLYNKIKYDSEAKLRRRNVVHNQSEKRGEIFQLSNTNCNNAVKISQECTHYYNHRRRNIEGETNNIIDVQNSNTTFDAVEKKTLVANGTTAPTTSLSTSTPTPDDKENREGGSDGEGLGERAMSDTETYLILIFYGIIFCCIGCSPVMMGYLGRVYYFRNLNVNADTNARRRGRRHGRVVPYEIARQMSLERRRISIDACLTTVSVHRLEEETEKSTTTSSNDNENTEQLEHKNSSCKEKSCTSNNHNKRRLKKYMPKSQQQSDKNADYNNDSHTAKIECKEDDDSKNDDEDNDDVICQICLEPFKVGELKTWSNVSHCDHAFHHDCIEPWLQRHSTCPTCRDNFYLQVVD